VLAYGEHSVALVDIGQINGLDGKNHGSFLTGARDFHLLQCSQTGYLVHSVTYQIHTRCRLPNHGVKLATHNLLVLRLRIHGAMQPLSHMFYDVVFEFKLRNIITPTVTSVSP
jgi:hypothetical protein